MLCQLLIIPLYEMYCLFVGVGLYVLKIVAKGISGDGVKESGRGKFCLNRVVASICR